MSKWERAAHSVKSTAGRMKLLSDAEYTQNALVGAKVSLQ